MPGRLAAEAFVELDGFVMAVQIDVEAGRVPKCVDCSIDEELQIS